MEMNICDVLVTHLLKRIQSTGFIIVFENLQEVPHWTLMTDNTGQFLAVSQYDVELYPTVIQWLISNT